MLGTATSKQSLKPSWPDLDILARVCAEEAQTVFSLDSLDNLNSLDSLDSLQSIDILFINNQRPYQRRSIKKIYIDFY